MSFTSLMRDLGVSKHPHVTWDIDTVRATNLKGTIEPLQIDGDLMAKTANFAVFDAAVDDPAKHRATGVKEGNLAGKVAIRPDALEFRNITVNTTHSVVNNVLVSIGFHELLRGSPVAGRDAIARHARVLVIATYRDRAPVSPLSSCSPRNSNVRPEPSNASCVVPEASTSPAPAIRPVSA